MLHGDEKVDIVCVQGHYEGHVSEEFVVSGDTWIEVYHDLEEMGYVK
jgi:hypothetical protein